MPQNPAVVNRLLKILTEQYPYVKEAILWLEIHTGEKSKRCIYELRDALDHIAIAVQADVSEEDAFKSLNALEEHLRRATVEPAEWIALEELQKLLKIKSRGLWWWRLFLLKPPNSKEFNETIYKGQELIVQGRYFKGISLPDSYNKLKEAYTILHELLDKVQPAELNSRIFALILFFLGIVVCSIVPMIIRIVVTIIQ